MLMFELKGKLAHFRRPDTMVTHATYPFIPRTVLRGLLASVLGLPKLTGENLTGIRLLSPLRTCTQELSMLGKGWLGGGGDSFNRPTSIELVINPHYLIYYHGEHLERLCELIKERRSYYHTYLGSAFCLTFPRFVDLTEGSPLSHPLPEKLECRSVLPSHTVEGLIPQDKTRYARVGGMHYDYLGERCFEGTINLIYDMGGRPISFSPRKAENGHPYKFVRLQEGEVICLW
ncbi:MAG: CRISPR-associated protein Cas5 [Bacillota bacterium]